MGFWFFMGISGEQLVLGGGGMFSLYSQDWDLEQHQGEQVFLTNRLIGPQFRVGAVPGLLLPSPHVDVVFQLM